MRLYEIEKAVYKSASDKNRQEPPRRYLGASAIGKPCERALWLGLRHEGKPVEGRICRLFQTGHDHEERIITELRVSGYSVTHQQDRREIKFEGGTFSGALDGYLPHYGSAGLEIKTHNDKSFKDLVKKGVKGSKPVHYDQMQSLMGLHEFPLFLYVAENKNDSTIYAEQIERDQERIDFLMKKAERILNAESPPPMISSDPAYYICKMCDFNHVCRKDHG